MRPLLLALALLTVVPARAQAPRTFFSVEAGGSGGLYSLGMERFVGPSTSVRVGVAAYDLFGGTVAVPLTAQAAPVLARPAGREIRAEVGGGVVLAVHESAYLLAEATDPGTGGPFGAYPVMTGAVRVRAGDLAFRVGASAIFGAWGPGRPAAVMPLFGLSLAP